eukprot:sb/3477346/
MREAPWGVTNISPVRELTLFGVRENCVQSIGLTGQAPLEAGNARPLTDLCKDHYKNHWKHYKMAWQHTMECTSNNALCIGLAPANLLATFPLDPQLTAISIIISVGGL